MLSWDDLRYLLALARAGSLAAAGRALGVEHTTVGRRIDALERALGVRLFLRTATGYTLTAEGEALIPSIARMEDAVFALERTSQGKDARLEGTVRVTAAEAFGSRFVAPRLGVALRERHPHLSVELVTGVRALDLARREADVAMRFFRTNADGVFARQVGTIRFALYVSKEYVARRGSPTLADLPQHDRIGSDSADSPLVEDQWFERKAKASRCVLRSNSTACMLSSALAGLGVALLPCFLGDAEPTLLRIPADDEPTRGIWVTVHRDVRDTPRIRAVLDVLAAIVEHDAAKLDGRPITPKLRAPKGSPKKERNA